jgi:two-component system, OmpR family, response regulator
MRILLVEDDVKIAEFIRKGLTQAGYSVDLCCSGEEALETIRSTRFECAVIDIMLPGIDGLSVIETIRSEGIHIPILILSARHTVDDRVKGFQTGGDDYLVKPFSFVELLARIQALIRRAGRTPASGSLAVADLELDPLSRQVRRADRVIELQPREYQLLEYLMRNTGRVLTKTMILEAIWNYDFDPQTNVVDVLVSRLRSRIDRDFDKKLIHTIRGVGYVLKEN